MPSTKEQETAADTFPASASSNDPGPKPELKWIKIIELYIDHEYQRSAKSRASLKNLEYLREHFSWANCGALIVCHAPEKKQYAVVDGQHRFIAAQARGDINELPCVVIQGQDFQKQAKSFVAINTKRVSLNTLAAFHAGVAAGNPDAAAVKEIVDECKIDIPRVPVNRGDTAPRQVQCVGTLVNLLGGYSKKQIVWALTIIPEAYGDERGQMRASLIKGLAEFIRLNPDADRERMVDVLSGVDPEGLEADARSYMAIKGGTAKAAVTEALDRLYKNAGRKSVA